MWTHPGQLAAFQDPWRIFFATEGVKMDDLATCRNPMGLTWIYFKHVVKAPDFGVSSKKFRNLKIPMFTLFSVPAGHIDQTLNAI